MRRKAYLVEKRIRDADELKRAKAQAFAVRTVAKEARCVRACQEIARLIYQDAEWARLGPNEMRERVLAVTRWAFYDDASKKEAAAT